MLYGENQTINIMTLKNNLAVDEPKTTTKEMVAELCVLSASSSTPGVPNQSIAIYRSIFKALEIDRE